MSDIPYSVRGGRSTTSVDGLTDTTITNLQNQQILKYDSASQKWVNAVDGGGDATISSLGDTLISNPLTNQSLVYNATVSPARWENQVTPFTQSDFTNAVSTDAAFIKHKPIISTTSSSTMVGMNTGVNKEGDLTAFGKGAGNAAKDGHICIGQISGNQGAARAISLGYNTHSTHDNSVVIHGGSGRSSSAANAFYIDPLRTINALTETAGNMKINMYNTSTKEIFLTDNLLVPGKTKLNGTLEVSNGIGSVNQVLTSNNTGALTWTDKSQLTYTAAAGGTGLSLTGTVFENTKPDETVILNNGNNVNVTGTYPQFTINSTDTNTTYTAAAGGTGLSLTGTVFENTKPDLTVVLNNGNNVNVTGTYPSFTINSTDTNTTYTAAAGGTGLSLTGTVFENTKPDLTVVLNNGSNVNVTGTYPSFTINSTDTNTTYTNGSNMSLVGTEFNIPQSVATTASPSFTALTLGNTGTNQGVINLQDVTNTGRDTVANIKGFKDGTNGGDLQFFTKVDGGGLTEKLRINNEGKLGFRGAAYGTANQYLKNNASGLPEWTTVTSVSQAPLDTPVVATPSGTGNITLTSGTGLNTLLTYTPPLVNTLPYFIFHKSSSQTIPNSGGAVDNVDITWDGLFTASPLTAASFAGGPTLFKVGVAGMYHLDINAEIGGTGAAKVELNVYIDGVLKNQSIINVYDGTAGSGDNVRETSLSCSFLKSLTALNVIRIEARAILLVTGTTMVVVASATTNRTQISGFRVGPG